MMLLVIVLGVIYILQLLAVFISLVEEVGEIPDYQFFATKKKIVLYLIPYYFLVPVVKGFIELINDLAFHIRGLK